MTSDSSMHISKMFKENEQVFSELNNKCNLCCALIALKTGCIYLSLNMPTK